MAFDINKFNESLNQIMPYIVQEEMRRKQFQEQIKGWTQYDIEKMKRQQLLQEQLNKLYQDRALMESLFSSFSQLMKGHSEGMPYPGDYFMSEVNKYFPGMAAEGVVGKVPENYPELYDQAMGDIKQGLIALKARDPEKYTDEAIQGMLYSRGANEVKDLINEILSAHTGEREQDLRSATLEEQAKTRGVRERELEELTKRREYEERTAGTKAAAGGADQKDAIKKLESLYKQRYSLLEDYLGAGVETDTKETKAKEALILNLNKQISSLKKQAGIQTEEDAEYMRGAKRLKDNGYTQKDLLENQELIRRLQSQGIIPILMLEYF